ncbi:hypothetical protein GCM10025857_41310 [Alicyclobacillus contaminans]|uniref:Uncharacterized protein n=1 Tax=Tetragenococcus osmophilus TaxID=526944 RepID=A0AA38CZF0_9ENTE|nr:hypothetical protein GCM10025857_41310 [Alicyclobacillus contaminans]GMA73224.1 hypothetical protein GCM10025885_22730 [Tetragenococcus osmophilus]
MGKQFINGSFVNSHSDRTIEVLTQLIIILLEQLQEGTKKMSNKLWKDR